MARNNDFVLNENNIAYEKAYKTIFNLDLFTPKLDINPITSLKNGHRPFSLSFEGAALGDEGKGSVVAREVARYTSKNKKAIVYRWNGGSNAGHECKLKNGKLIALHQFPSGVIVKNTIAVLGRGMVFHLGDALAEIEIIKKNLGKIPAKIFIDPNITLCLDTHRALETLVSNWYIDYGGGSTGKGIAMSYSDVLLRTKLTGNDLISSEWRKKFLYHYILIEKHLKGFGLDLKSIRVSNLLDPSKTMPVGSRKEFLERTALERNLVLKYFKQDLYDFMEKEWRKDTLFIFEGANGVGLSPYHGVYPDVTSSETRARGIQDSTEGIVDFKKISLRCGVLKGPYMSSVGLRRMPGELSPASEVKIRNDYNEFGKTSGRPRGVLPIDLPAIKYWRKVSDYEYLVVTHMDAGFKNIDVILNYRDKKGEVVNYRPYQWYLDQVTPEFITLPGWSAKDIVNVKDANDLPKNVLRYLQFLELALEVKIAWITTGQDEDNFVSFLPTTETSLHK